MLIILHTYDNNVISFMSKFYLTTAIAYTNAKPHLGHALEFVFADVIARYKRLSGADTYFLTGTDEHGSKIYKTAKEQGIDTQEFVDKNAAYFIDLAKDLGLSNDDFIRTTSELHKRGAVKIWNKLYAAGDIYSKKYEGLYCSGCEVFLNPKDLVEGKCEIHLKEPELVQEENYFFSLSKYSDKIKDLIKSDTLKIYPDSRKNEMLALLEEGLTDVSFSRPKSVLPHGITVPTDENQVMYVWCDALTNYLTALGYADEDEKFLKYWPADLHIIGKDIIRFHAGIWIGMLLSANLDLPKAIGVHGFVTSEGKKMSKSLGNVVDPIELLETYSLDSVRFYLCREVPTGDDGDFSHERFKIVYSSDLANNFGNLASRSVTMLHKYFEGVVPEVESFSFEQEFMDCFDQYNAHMNNFDIKKAIEAVLEFLNLLNKCVEDNRPWDLAKDEANLPQLSQVMFDLIEGVRRANYLLNPFICDATAKLATILGVDISDGFEKAFAQNLSGKKLLEIEPLFPRI
jgi:methionyl-tRNA synthetase